MTGDELIDLALHGEPSRADLERLRDRLSADAELRARFVRAVRFDSELHHALRRSPARVLLARRPALAAFVAALLLLVVGWWWLERPLPYEMPLRATGGPRTLVLDDGTRVDLVAGAELVRHRPRAGERSLVELSAGSAAFTVSHGGGTFRIATGAAEVVVLGTRFDIANLRGERPAIQVVVREGRVRVERDGSACELAAGESRRFESPARFHQVAGRIIAADAAKRTLVLASSEDRRRSGQTLTVAEGALLLVDGRGAEFRALPAGASVLVQLSSFGDLATTVEVVGVGVTGTLEQDGPALVLAVPQDDRSVALRLPLDPVLRWIGKPGQAAPAAAGVQVRAWTSRDHSRVVRIEMPEERPGRR